MQASQDSSPPPSSYRPGVVEVYILAAGILLGVLLGPAVLGRASPATHAKLFAGGPAYEQWAQHADETAERLATLSDTGVTPDALPEYLAERQEQASLKYGTMNAVMDRNALQKIAALWLLLSAVMLLGALLNRGQKVCSLAAYSLAGLGLATLIARPSALLSIFGG